jgi:hypothetical protein
MKTKEDVLSFVARHPGLDAPFRSEDEDGWMNFEWFRGAQGAEDSSRFTIWIVPDPNPNPCPHPDDTSEWCYTYHLGQEHGPLDGSEDAAVERFLGGVFQRRPR